MKTYFVTINSVKSEFTNLYAAYKVVADTIYEDDEAVVSLAVDDPRGEVWNSQENFSEDLDVFYIEELALLYDFETTETVEGGLNGYPEGFETALTGFKNWEQAKEFADNNGLLLVWLHRRDGWQNWERKDFALRPFDVTAMLEYLGYDFCTTDSAKDFMAGELMDGSWQDYDDYQDMVDRLDDIKAVCDLLEDREDNQVVLYNLDSGSEPILCDKGIISCSDDTHSYCLGAIVL